MLRTLPALMEAQAIQKLRHRDIAFHLETVGATKINIFFGDADWVEIVKRVFRKPLQALTAEEDFILSTMLGYSRLGSDPDPHGGGTFGAGGVMTITSSRIHLANQEANDGY